MIKNTSYGEVLSYCIRPRTFFISYKFLLSYHLNRYFCQTERILDDYERICKKLEFSSKLRSFNHRLQKLE